MISVILPAGGSGTRMRSRTPKILHKLGGKPILIRTLEAFRGIGGIREIVLALPARSIPSILDRFGSAFMRLGVKKIISGGRERQDSVENALSVVHSGSKWVLIHDAARPLVSAAEIRAVIRAGKKSGAAILALPSRDTVKEVIRGRIRGTLDRAGIWRALTPQFFRADWIRSAYTRNRGRPVTDDAQLLERAGRKVAVVEGSVRNLKVTTKEDLRLAVSFLQSRP